MSRELLILILEAVVVYLLVLGTHALRHRCGTAPFYVLLGTITAVMSWVTDAGASVSVGTVTFMVGSTVFYTSLLLGVFVVYVFDGPWATRVAIMTIAGVSALTPLIAAVLHMQLDLIGSGALAYVPEPSLRINTASVVATMMDFVFLAVVWESLGTPKHAPGIGLRAFLSLLGVMCLDVLLFNTGAFLGTPGYLGILGGTLISRLVIAAFAWPFLYLYLTWQERKPETCIENRPVLAILKQVAEVRGQLVSAQREVERRKSAEREKEALLAAMPAPVFYKDRYGRYRGCNRAFEALVGMQRSEIVGRTAHDLWPEELADIYAQKDTELVRHAGNQIYEGEVRSKGGDIRAVIFSKATVPDIHGNVDGLIGVILDITDRKRMEAQRQTLEAELRQTQKLVSIGTLAGGVAHGINNPLMGVLNYVQLIQDDATPDSRIATLAADIHVEAERVADIVKKLLHFASEDNQARVPVRLSDMVEASLPLLQSAMLSDQIALEVDVPQTVPLIHGRPQQLQQVLFNVLTNAHDALNATSERPHEKKKICLTASLADRVWQPSPSSGHAAVQSKQSLALNEAAYGHDITGGQGGWIRLTVADNGMGIGQDIIERVFDPFFTTKDRAHYAGLGLYAAVGIIREHGGALAVESQVGSWTRFHIDLPVQMTTDSKHQLDIASCGEQK